MVSAAFDPAQRHRLPRGFDACLQERIPVIGKDCLQRRHDIGAGIGQDAPIAVAHAVKRMGKIIDALFSAGAVANDLIGFKPDQRAFGVIVFAARQLGVDKENSGERWLASG